MGGPGDVAKGFDQSAGIGPSRAVDDVVHVAEGSIQALVNGVVKQNADLNELIWSVPEVVSFLSHTIRICPGDLIMTGTPAGVGALQSGDTCTVAIEGLGEIRTQIVDPV